MTLTPSEPDPGNPVRDLGPPDYTGVTPHGLLSWLSGRPDLIGPTHPADTPPVPAAHLDPFSAAPSGFHWGKWQRAKAGTRPDEHISPSSPAGAPARPAHPDFKGLPDFFKTMPAELRTQIQAAMGRLPPFLRPLFNDPHSPFSQLFRQLGISSGDHDVPADPGAAPGGAVAPGSAPGGSPAARPDAVPDTAAAPPADGAKPDTATSPAGTEPAAGVPAQPAAGDTPAPGSETPDEMAASVGGIEGFPPGSAAGGAPYVPPAGPPPSAPAFMPQPERRYPGEPEPYPGAFSPRQGWLESSLRQEHSRVPAVTPEHAREAALNPGSDAGVPIARPHPGFGADRRTNARRPRHYTGTLSINGKQFHYGTGGGHTPSIPYGRYYIHPGAIGPRGHRIGAIAGVSDSNSPHSNTLTDPTYLGGARTHAREGIEIHPSQSLMTNGCVGISAREFGAFKREFARLARRGPLELIVRPDGSASITSLGGDSRLAGR